MYYVIGSGPAAIAATMALISAGKEVTILDVGKTLEPEHQQILTRLSHQTPNEWDTKDLDFLRNKQKKRHGNIHSKFTYGSAYSYGDIAEPIIADPTRLPFNYSMARGGLSNVWGASLLPVHAEDIRDWPITLADLTPHYKAILDFMPSATTEDTLEKLLPRYTTHDNSLRSSRQVTEFLHDLQCRRGSLEKKGIYFGKSRIAVTASSPPGKECIYCGLCLYGCPYSLIYSTAQMLNDLVKEKKVHYIRDRKVVKLELLPNGVLIHTHNTANTPITETFQAERVFLGTGVLPTASIVLHSLNAFHVPIRMVDSQYFIFPFFRFAHTQGVETETLHSLAQAFLEIHDKRVSPHLIHLEVFSYSHFLHNALLETPLGFLLKNRWAADQFLGRLLVLQCFLHSADSGSLQVELRSDHLGQPKLHITPQSSWHALWRSLQTGLKLAANTLILKGFPMIPAIQFAQPGRSYHSGGTFPMRSHPSRFETDITGQLPELERIHLIDASVFPSIPATTITLTVMANAHRIATKVATEF